MIFFFKKKLLLNKKDVNAGKRALKKCQLEQKDYDECMVWIYL